MNGKIYVYLNRKKYEEEGIKKYYVGQTSKTLLARAGTNGQGYHKYDNNLNSKFANSIRKWGWDAFEGEILVDQISSQDELNELEIMYIEKYDSFNNGYNSTKGGDGVTGCKHTGMYGKKYTDEHRKKLSESHKGLLSGENHPMWGKHHSEETIEKIKEARKKQVGENHPMYGKKWSYDTMIKQGKAVFCKELNKAFDAISLAQSYCKEHNLKANKSNIIANCKGRRNSAGYIIDEEGNKIPLHWEYVVVF